MTHTRPEQLLLDTLRVFPPQSIYADAERKQIIRGFQLYIDHRVKRIGWEEGGVLVVDISGRAPNLVDPVPVSVRIFRDNLELRSICTCNGAEPHGRCEHFVCALVTLLHLLRPNLFRMTKENPAYRDQLEAGLLRKPARLVYQERELAKPWKRADLPEKGVGPVYRVVMEASAGRLRASVEVNGKRMGEDFDFRAVPWEIAYLVRSGYQRDMSYALSVFLKRTDGLYPLFYEEDGQKHEVEWLGERVCPTWTELDARDGEIVVRKACALREEEGEPAWAVIGSFALNPSRSAMAQITPRTGWQCWDKLRALCTDEKAADRVKQVNGSEIHIPVDVYRSFQITLKKSKEKEALGTIRCMTGGREVPVGAASATRYGLTIRRDDRDPEGFLIEPRCWSGDLSFFPSHRIVTFVRSIEKGTVPASLRAKKRRPHLYEALFRGLEAPDRKSSGEVLKEAVDEHTFGRRKAAGEVRRSIRQAIDAFNGEDAHFLITDEGWRLVSVDKAKEKLLFLVCFAAFGPALFTRLTDEGPTMAVAQGLLMERLHAFHSLAIDMGIELSFEGRPIESVAWEFELDATETIMDWFEIRPEIRFNGRAIPKDLWEQALAGKGIIIRNGAIQILDGTSMKALAAVAELWNGTRARTGARAVTSIPRLRIIDLFLLRKKGVQVRLSDEDEALMKRLTEFSRIDEKTITSGLRADLRQYQKEGFYWLAFLYEHRFGACLADDMGLGKTIQALSLLTAIREGGVSRPSEQVSRWPSCRFLIVVPPSLLFNWEQEIERFCPLLKVYVYRGKERTTRPDGSDVMLTSYGLIRRDIARFKELLFDVIVFDEAQAIKNIFADTTGAVRQLKGLFKVALTGTPIENHLGEYFSIVDLVLPGLLGEYREFQGKARGDVTELLPVLKERTRPFVLRRTKEHILKELPPKVEHDVYLDLNDEQKRFYNRTVQEVRATIDAAYKGKTASQARIIALTAIMRLRQICLTPRLLVPELKTPSPKAEFLRGKLEELFSESHSALVFSQFTSFLDVVEAELRAEGVPVLRLDGSTPVARRKEIVESFQKSEAPCAFLLSLKAGGQGLNLTRATYVFHLDPWWNPAVENQASDRSHRIGQTQKVHVTRLLMRHTVEEKMTALKNRKQALYRALMDAPERSGARAITREDFDFLLG